MGSKVSGAGCVGSVALRGEKVEELHGPTMKIVQDVDHREAFFERD